MKEKRKPKITFLILSKEKLPGDKNTVRTHQTSTYSIRYLHYLHNYNIFHRTKRRGKIIKKDESLKDLISKKIVERKILEDLEESNRISNVLVLPWWMRIIIDRQK